MKGMSFMADGNVSNNNLENNSSDSNINITPEMISNLVNMLKNGNNFSNASSYDNTHSSAVDSGTSSSPQNSGSSFDSASSQNFSGASNIDFETIFKIKNIMETLNKKDDPRSNLLYSLKPYLRESRQKKLDQYVNLFKITQVTNLFKNDKGDES